MKKIEIANQVRVIIVGKSLTEIHTKILELAVEIRAMSQDIPQQPVITQEVVANQIFDQNHFPNNDTTAFDPAIPGADKTVETTIKDGQIINVVDKPVDSRGYPWDERIHSASKNFNKDGSWRYRRGVKDDEIEKIEAQLKTVPMSRPVPEVPKRVEAPTPVPQGSVVPSVQFGNAPMPTVSQTQEYMKPNTVIGEVFQTPPFPQGDVSTMNATQAMERMGPLQVVAPYEAPVQVSAPQTAQQPTQTAPAYDNIQVPKGKPSHTFMSFRDSFVNTMAGLVTDGKLTPDYIESLKSYFKVKEIWEVTKNEGQLQELFESLAKHGLINKVG